MWSCILLREWWGNSKLTSILKKLQRGQKAEPKQSDGRACPLSLIEAFSNGSVSFNLQMVSLKIKIILLLYLLSLSWLDMS